MLPTDVITLTLTEYYSLLELDLLQEDDQIELIKGQLVKIPEKRHAHSVCNTKLLKELYQLIQERAVIRSREPITLLTDSEPEPDLVIAKGKPDDYLTHHPYVDDILLIIHIFDSIYVDQQMAKLSLYAEKGIQHCWIINLDGNQLECFLQSL